MRTINYLGTLSKPYIRKMYQNHFLESTVLNLYSRGNEKPPDKQMWCLQLSSFSLFTNWTPNMVKLEDIT